MVIRCFNDSRYQGKGHFSSSVSAMQYHLDANRRSEAAAAKARIFKLAGEKGDGGPTDNPFLIASSWIATGQAPTAAIINEVLKYTGTPNAITEADVEAFKTAFANPLVLQGTLGTAAQELVKALGMSNQKETLFAVYVATMQVTGGEAVCVGSSSVTPKRLTYHAGGMTGSRLGQWVKEHGKDSFTVKIVLLPAQYLHSKPMLLALEQWAILHVFGVLRPHTRINYLLVANSTAQVLTPEQRAALQEQTGVKRYVYLDGVLLYVFPSSNELIAITCLTTYYITSLHSMYQGHLGPLLVTKDPIVDAPLSLMSTEAFVPYFNSIALEASQVSVAAIAQGQDPLTIPGSGPVLVKPGVPSHLTAVWTLDPSSACTGSLTEVYTWMRATHSQGTKDGLATAYKRRAPFYLNRLFKLSYDDPLS